MMIEKTSLNEIAYEDMKIIKNLAGKYDVKVADFGKLITRQSVIGTIPYRQVRVSDDEFKIISNKAENHGVTITKWCNLAFQSLLKSDKKSKNKIFYEVNSNKAGKRNKRIGVSIRKVADETKLLRISDKYSIPISTLFRYCALRFDGESIIVTNERDYAGRYRKMKKQLENKK
jgi:hypothetical protein